MADISPSTSTDADTEDKNRLLINQLDPLTKQQLLAINNLQQSSQQVEDALSQGMEALQQSLAETLAGYLGPSGSSGNVSNYMGQMAMAMGKLGTLEGFIRQFELSKIPYCLAPKCVRYLQRYRWISRRPTVQITEDFPIKSTGFILDLLENVESNVEIKGLDKHKSRGATCTEHMEENIHCLMNSLLLIA